MDFNFISGVKFIGLVQRLKEGYEYLGEIKLLNYR